MTVILCFIERMNGKTNRVTVYYDASCPGCVRDRRRYEAMAGGAAESTEWVDITGREEELRRAGIEPRQAMRELHVVDAGGRVHREMDAYILLMQRSFWLKPVGLLIGLPGIKQLLSRIYRWWVDRRLRRTGRL